MKLTRFLFLFALMGGIAFPQPRYSAWLVEKPPVIDGDLSEFSDKGFIFLERGSIPHYLWRGPWDIGAKVYLAWDVNSLYIASEVHDDIPTQEGEAWWESIQFYIPPLEITYSLSQKKLFVYKNGVESEELFPFAVKSLDNGYQIEVAIPWSSLGITPQEGTSLPFNAVVNDADLGGYRGYLSWAEGWKEGMGLGREANSLGEVTLASQPSPGEVFLFFAPSPLYIGEEEVDIPLWLVCGREVRGKLHFSLKKGEEVLLQKDEDLERAKGIHPLFVHWDARGKGKGVYSVEADLEEEGGEVHRSSLELRKYDAEGLAFSLQEEMKRMEGALGEAGKRSDWRSSVLYLQGKAWEKRANSLIEEIRKKGEEAKSREQDSAILARIYLWEAEEDVEVMRSSSALIRRDEKGIDYARFPLLQLATSPLYSYLWERNKWEGEGREERLTLFYASLPIVSLSFLQHPNGDILSSQMAKLLSSWGGVQEKVAGEGWQGMAVVSPTGGVRMFSLQGDKLWIVEALDKGIALQLLDCLLGKKTPPQDMLPSSLEPDILVEDIGEILSFDFPNACFYAGKDDEIGMRTANLLAGKLGGKVVRMEEVNRYKEVVIVGPLAMKQLLGAYKLPEPPRKAYLLPRRIWGKRVLLVVGEGEGTRLAGDVLWQMVENLGERKMFVGDLQSFTNASEGKCSPEELCLSAMGSFCDFLAITDVGTREGAKEALWLVGERSWKLSLIPGETLRFPWGEVIALASMDRIDVSGEAKDVVSAIHKGGGLCILGKGGNFGDVSFDAWEMREGVAKQPLVGVSSTSTGIFSQPQRTVFFSKEEGCYNLLSALKKGNCLAFSPFRMGGKEELVRLIRLLLDEREFLLGYFGRRMQDKARSLIE